MARLPGPPPKRRVCDKAPPLAFRRGVEGGNRGFGVADDDARLILIVVVARGVVRLVSVRLKLLESLREESEAPGSNG